MHAVQNKPKGRKIETSFKINPCFGCDELRLFKNCPFKNKECKNCWKFDLKEEATPIFPPKRQVPFLTLANIDNELERLEKLGVIEKTYYSPRESPIVYVEKKNKTRVCADYSTGLNDCLKQINYPNPSAEVVFAQLNGGRIFSKLDLSEAYKQIPVEEKCAEILTINSHKGLNKFLRLPFGIKVAPAIFQ